MSAYSRRNRADKIILDVGGRNLGQNTLIRVPVCMWRLALSVLPARGFLIAANVSPVLRCPP